MIDINNSVRYLIQKDGTDLFSVGYYLTEITPEFTTYSPGAGIKAISRFYMIKDGQTFDNAVITATVLNGTFLRA